MAAQNTPKTSGKATVTRNNRGDLTAKRKAELEKQNAAEQVEAAQNMAMATAAAQEENDSTVTNWTQEPVSEEEAAAVGASAVETKDPTVRETLDDILLDDEEEIAPPPATEMVRAREDCRFTFGAGNEYVFSAGRSAKVPFEVAQHMREKGLIWD